MGFEGRRQPPQLNDPGGCTGDILIGCGVPVNTYRADQCSVPYQGQPSRSMKCRHALAADGLRAGSCRISWIDLATLA